MSFTKLKKKKSISNRVTAVSTAVAMGLSSLGVMNVCNNPMVAAENEPKLECSYGLAASLVSMSFKALNDDVLITPVVTTTSSLTTSTTATTTTSTTSTSMTTTSTSTTTTTTVTEPETTTTETEETTTVETTTEIATTEEEPVETEPPREYVVYKPSTHYIHRSTCRWMSSECYEIENTEGLECRKCSECNPDMEIVTEFVVEQPQQQATVAAAATNNDGGYYSLNFITDVERIYLCNVVGTEYGSDCVPLYDKACVVATVMNRVHDGGWTRGLPSTVYNVITAPYQYNPDYAVPYYRSNVTQSCIDAVEYYFQHQSEFPHYTSFCGDGRYNYFR